MTQYAAAAAFVRSLVGRGLSHAVVSPGLRSVPLSLTVDAMPGLDTTIAHDERVAGFTALGIARATRRPVLVVCTSGSAVANLLPAVVEAFHARLPLIVATGDRPAELRGWDSPQTIDQVGIFGTFAPTIEIAPADEADGMLGAEAAGAAWGVAAGLPPAPVHVNWLFREPLEPDGPIVVEAAAARSVEPSDLGPLGERDAVDPVLAEAVASISSGVIAAGELSAPDRAAVRRLAMVTGWPIVADPQSGLRTDADDRLVITTADHLLAADAFADAHVPEVVVRAGSAPTSKSLRLWMERNQPKRVVVVDVAARRRDPSRTMTDLVASSFSSFASEIEALRPEPDEAWSAAWFAAEQVARRVIAGVVDEVFEEGAATRATAASLGAGTVWHVASSTPIRDVDWYVHATAAAITSNRGTNGIDGTVATATGLAVGSGGPVVVTLGDVAAVHDAGGILGTRNLEHPPTIVVYANGGGGIFSLLPIAEATDRAAFDRVLHTPLDVDLAALAAAGGLNHHLVHDAAALRGALKAGLAGERALIEVRVTVPGSRDQLRTIRSEIAGAL